LEPHATRFEALEPVRQGVREHFGGFAKGIARGLAVRHDHGSQYLSAFMITGTGVHDPAESAFSIDRNRCSRSTGMHVHDGPERAVHVWKSCLCKRYMTVMNATFERYHVAAERWASRPDRRVA
jgi:hypothetical protein